MSISCSPSPTNKKEYIADIGKELVNTYGKKDYYQPEEVQEAHRNSKWYDGTDFSCWAMSFFSSHSSFDKHHKGTGDICNYTEMKTEMLQAFSTTKTTSWIDIPEIDLDASWLDFGDMFDGVSSGIGEFLGGIFEGLG